MPPSAYDVDLRKASEGWNGQDYWVQSRCGAIPPRRAGENPTVVLTMQKCLLSGSDLFYAIHSLHTRDRAATWSRPVEQPAFRRQKMPDGSERTVCDFWPKWHAASGTLLGTGHTVYYTPENKIVPGYRPRQTAYAVYDPRRQAWPQWRSLEMPAEEKFHSAGAGCTQRIDLENGEILLPVYFGGHRGVRPSASTVVRCRFDGSTASSPPSGQTLQYVEHGTELTTPVERGFAEPSLACFQGRYFLALRNDVANHVTAGDDGLHFGPAIEWRFDDGQPLGSYNTQQHWIARDDALYLVYTRRGLNNDHVFRHRAPMLMAQVDPDRLCVLRHTERAVMPNRGARLGNFGICDVAENETWIVDTEWMQPAGCEKYGSNNSVWVARILFR